MLYIYNIKVLDEGHTSVVRLPNKIVLSAGCYGFRISFYVFYFLYILFKFTNKRNYTICTML